MPEFVVVRHGRPLTERLESGIADPSLDEWLNGLDGAGLRARHDGVNRLVGQPGADSLGLPATELVEGRVGDARFEPFGQRPPVTNANELGHQETPVSASSG